METNPSGPQPVASNRTSLIGWVLTPKTKMKTKTRKKNWCLFSCQHQVLCDLTIHAEKRLIRPAEILAFINRRLPPAATPFSSSSQGLMGALVPLLETTWPWSDLSARPCLASAASERHFSPGSPEETPLHTMLFLPAAALCWLGSALAAMATLLVQDHLTLTRRTGQSVSFSCGGTRQCYSGYPVVWYQKKETETFRAILYIYTGDNPGKPYNHPQQDDFSAERDQSSSSLKINKVKLDHSASYYCGCRKSGSHSEK